MARSEDSFRPIDERMEREVEYQQLHEEAVAMLREIVEKNGSWPSDPKARLFKAERLVKMALKRLDHDA